MGGCGAGNGRDLCGEGVMWKLEDLLEREALEGYVSFVGSVDLRL